MKLVLSSAINVDHVFFRCIFGGEKLSPLAAWIRNGKVGCRAMIQDHQYDAKHKELKCCYLKKLKVEYGRLKVWLWYFPDSFEEFVSRVF